MRVDSNPMKILHVLDHSLPVHTGYTFRTRNILKQQLARGWQTAQLTGSKHPLDGPDPETVDGLLFHRTRGRSSLAAPFPSRVRRRAVQRLYYVCHWSKLDE